MQPNVGRNKTGEENYTDHDAFVLNFRPFEFFPFGIDKSTI